MITLADYQAKWEKRAIVRSRPRIIIDPNDKGFFYPLSNQPLCSHPKISNLGETGLHYLLIQSLYKYFNDIAVIETKIVNKAVFDLINDAFPVMFDDDFKIGAFTVLVDESYHGYVAFDAMKQIQDHTGIKVLPLPTTIEIEKAINIIKSNLDEKYHTAFELIAVCIAENTLTQDIVSMVDQEETHPFFQKILKDHLFDESRHCGYFLAVLEYFWSHLEEDYKINIGNTLADFIKLYLGVDVQISFDKKTLSEMGFSETEALEILSDTYNGFQVTSQHPLLKNIIKQLERAGVLDQRTLPIFEKSNLISKVEG